MNYSKHAFTFYRSACTLIAFALSFSFLHSAFGETYRTGKYTNLFKRLENSKNDYTIPLNSIDRIIMTAQALILQKKSLTRKALN